MHGNLHFECVLLYLWGNVTNHSTFHHIAYIFFSAVRFVQVFRLQYWERAMTDSALYEAKTAKTILPNRIIVSAHAIAVYATLFFFRVFILFDLIIRLKLILILWTNFPCIFAAVDLIVSFCQLRNWSKLLIFVIILIDSGKNFESKEEKRKPIES